MIKLEKGQKVFDKPNLVVYETSGYYNDGDPVICALESNPEEPVCRFEAQFIAYGSMVYAVTDQKKLMDEILKMDPASLFGKTTEQVAVDQKLQKIVPEKPDENPEPTEEPTPEPEPEPTPEPEPEPEPTPEPVPNPGPIGPPGTEIEPIDPPIDTKTGSTTIDIKPIPDTLSTTTQEIINNTQLDAVSGMTTTTPKLDMSDIISSRHTRKKRS